MSHDSKKFIKTQVFSLIVAVVLALFAYQCKNIPVFVGTFTIMSDAVLVSILLSLRAAYKRFHVNLYQLMFIGILVFTILINILAITQIM